jgi:hypothetical protein
LRPRTDTPPPLTHCIVSVYLYLFTQRRRVGEGELIQTEVYRGTVHKAGSKIPT